MLKSPSCQNDEVNKEIKWKKNRLLLFFFYLGLVNGKAEGLKASLTLTITTRHCKRDVEGDYYY